MTHPLHPALQCGSCSPHSRGSSIADRTQANRWPHDDRTDIRASNTVAGATKALPSFRHNDGYLSLASRSSSTLGGDSKSPAVARCIARSAYFFLRSRSAARYVAMYFWSFFASASASFRLAWTNFTSGGLARNNLAPAGSTLIPLHSEIQRRNPSFSSVTTISIFLLNATP